MARFRTAILAVALGLAPMTLAAPPEAYSARLALGDWKPTELHFIDAQGTVKHDYAAWLGRNGPVLRTWSQYRFQYWGERRGKRRVLHLNAFCQDFWGQAPDWRRTIVLVKDGGDCFFQAEVDVDAGALVGFSINGEA